MERTRIEEVFGEVFTGHGTEGVEGGSIDELGGCRIAVDGEGVLSRNGAVCL